MCINCTDGWRNARSFGPIRWGYGQICEDKSSWICWLLLFNRAYLGLIPARCYWKPYAFIRGQSEDQRKVYRFGGGQVKTYLKPDHTEFTWGPLNLSFRSSNIV